MEWFLSGTTGWVLTALIFLGFGAALWWQRRRKAKHVSKHWPPIVIPGFAGVNVPKLYPFMPGQPTGDLAPLSYEVAKLEARILYDIQRAVWEKCVEVYGVTYNTNEAFQQKAQGWCVDEIGITSDPEAMPKGHPFVVWAMPNGPIHLLFQYDMYFWFAHEVHNVFRYLLHGPNHIYDTVDGEDRANARAVQVWIDDEHPRGEE